MLLRHKRSVYCRQICVMNMLLVFLRAVVARRLAGYDAWATAPPCSKAPVGSSKSDSNGRLWGAENGNSCAYKDEQQQALYPNQAVMQQDFATARACGEQPDPNNSQPDSLGRLWGVWWGNSCAFRTDAGKPLYYPGFVGHKYISNAAVTPNPASLPPLQKQQAVPAPSVPSLEPATPVSPSNLHNQTFTLSGTPISSGVKNSTVLLPCSSSLSSNKSLQTCSCSSSPIIMLNATEVAETLAHSLWDMFADNTKAITSSSSSAGDSVIGKEDTHAHVDEPKMLDTVSGATQLKVGTVLSDLLSEAVDQPIAAGNSPLATVQAALSQQLNQPRQHRNSTIPALSDTADPDIDHSQGGTSGAHLHDNSNPSAKNSGTSLDLSSYDLSIGITDDIDFDRNSTSVGSRGAGSHGAAGKLQPHANTSSSNLTITSALSPGQERPVVTESVTRPMRHTSSKQLQSRIGSQGSLGPDVGSSSKGQVLEAYLHGMTDPDLPPASGQTIAPQVGHYLLTSRLLDLALQVHDSNADQRQDGFIRSLLQSYQPADLEVAQRTEQVKSKQVQPSAGLQDTKTSPVSSSSDSPQPDPRHVIKNDGKHGNMDCWYQEQGDYSNLTQIIKCVPQGSFDAQKPKAATTQQSSQGSRPDPTWEEAPACKHALGGSDVVADGAGKLWGWDSVLQRSCAFKGTTTYETAPRCRSQPTGRDVVRDAQGRLWGWQDEASCKY